MRECPCGSGEMAHEVRDGYGIFLCYACDKCEAKKMKSFRPDIMDGYVCDEPIEPE